jgi:predicted sulfurtransferase
MRIKFTVLLLVIASSLLLRGSLQAADKTPQQLVEEARTQITSVSILDVETMLDAGEDIIILDVRDKEEFQKGHLPAALNISRGLLEFMVEDKIPDKNAKIIVY